MKITAALTLAALLSISCAVARHLESPQRGKYAEGYLVKNNGDLVRGLLRDRSSPPDVRRFSRVRVRTGGLFPKRYGPNRLLRYCIGADCYESLWIERHRKFLREIYVNRPGTGRRQFLKVVVEGHLTLYQMEFYDAELRSIDHFELFGRADRDYLIRATQGIFGLKKSAVSRYLSDCPPLVEKINSGEIKAPAEVARYYNECRFFIGEHER